MRLFALSAYLGCCSQARLVRAVTARVRAPGGQELGAGRFHWPERKARFGRSYEENQSMITKMLRSTALAAALAASSLPALPATAQASPWGWHGWGWGGFGIGLAAGLIGTALAAPYWGYGYPAYGFYPAYSYYPAYRYYPAYGYGYGYPYYYGGYYAPRYYGYGYARAAHWGHPRHVYVRHVYRHY